MLGGFYAHTMSDNQRAAYKNQSMSEAKAGRGRTISSDSSVGTFASGGDQAAFEYKPSFRFCLDSMVVDLIKSVDGHGSIAAPSLAHSKSQDKREAESKKPVMRMAYTGGIFA
ncbi:hypothetical protein ACHHYP_09015 [Achlya hypogyna]|uniref:Uncharacterized protein n=1 Tax=Achlya hypogyna TaxID=1202772 RepID=A0A1V9ZJT9_ACHHY|nr:hypothetical protein ACHHYP_09015 [Achlya hypogyna]